MVQKSKIAIRSAIVAVLFAGMFVILFLLGVFTPSNYSKYDPDKCESQTNALTGKTIYWLGSSVTLGMESKNVAVADYVAARNGAICKKEAVSGTTLIDKEFKGKASYVSRLQSTDQFDKSAKIDAFVCQISTNDAKAENVPLWGEISQTARSGFNVQTTLGAMEFIITYVEQTWDCPVYFYSGAYVAEKGLRSSDFMSGPDYAKLIQKTYELAEKWNKVEGYDVRIIDLFNDKAFNDISDEDYKKYMHDAVHPYKAGYLEWWTPAFESRFLNDLK